MLLAAALVSTPAVAHADDPSDVIPARVAWVRDESALSCPDVIQVETRLRARLDGDPFRGTPRRLIEATVRRTEGIFVVHIMVRDVDGRLRGTRDLTSTSSDCGGIANAAILTMALSLTDADVAEAHDSMPADHEVPATTATQTENVTNANASPRDVVTASTSTTTSPPTPRVVYVALDGEVPRPPAPEVVAPPTFVPSLGAGLDMLVHVGLLPFASAAPGIFVDARVHPFVSLGLGAEWLPDQAMATPYGRHDFGMTVVHGDVCVHMLRSVRYSLAGCASLWAGAIHAVVYETQPVNPGLGAWFGASTSIRGTVDIVGPLQISLEAGAVLSLSRYHYRRADHESEIFAQSPVGAIAHVGLGVRFR